MRKGMSFWVIGMALVMGGVAFAQEEADFDTTAAGNGVVISAYKGAGGAVVIPAAIGGKAVVGIGSHTFSGCASLTSVTIPAGVTAIGGWAFDECDSLKTVTIPASVISIGEGAFHGCFRLKPEISADIEKRFGNEPFRSLW